MPLAVISPAKLFASPTAAAPAPILRVTRYARPWPVVFRLTSAILLHAIPVRARVAFRLVLKDDVAAIWAVPLAAATVEPPLTLEAPSWAPALLGTRVELHLTPEALVVDAPLLLGLS